MSKITYWRCVDCGSMINDENMYDGVHIILEFCISCMNYGGEVVVAYD